MELNIKENYMSFSKLDNENVINLFTFKPYNFRSQLVSKEQIEKNYKSLENSLNKKFKKIIKPIQTHTNIVKVVDESNLNDTFQDVDGLVTNLKDVALVVSVADCQGILLYDKKNKVIGNIHSGWKGTLNRILENAINLMIDEFNSNISDIEVFIAPSILKCCFEVDTDVALKFKEEFKDIDIDSLITYKKEINKYYIDTVEINKQVMLKLGLKEENIVLSNICTKCNSDKIHSYRKDKDESGRNITLICME